MTSRLPFTLSEGDAVAGVEAGRWTASQPLRLRPASRASAQRERRGLGLTVMCVSLLLVACGDDPFNRMVEQPKLRPQADGANRVPPAGTVARERQLELERQAPPMTMALLQKGRHRYEIVCATCHGLTGEADTVVAGNFAQRHPPSFHEPRLREKDDAYLFNAITLGYGVMPSFPEIPVEERWGIVGYVRALQLSQRATLEQAPAEEQQRLKGTK